MQRFLAVLALAASLGTPLTSSPFDFVWSSVASLWEAPATNKSGFGWDPNGLNSPPPPSTQTESGCGWDPSGASTCSPAPTASSGS